MKEIIISLQIEGIHCWPSCPFEEVLFLRDPHRHVFHIECRKEVTHDDRQIEIIMLKHSVLDYLYEKFYSKTLKSHDFGAFSCEIIAGLLMEHFNLTYCKVLEDGENGACITKRD